MSLLFPVTRKVVRNTINASEEECLSERQKYNKNNTQTWRRGRVGASNDRLLATLIKLVWERLATVPKGL